MPDMLCSIYKGRKKPDTYLFVPVRDRFDHLPEAILTPLGELEHVMDLVLTPSQKMARENPVQVMRNLLTKGCHIQLPPAADEDITKLD